MHAHLQVFLGELYLLCYINYFAVACSVITRFMYYDSSLPELKINDKNCPFISCFRFAYFY